MIDSFEYEINDAKNAIYKLEEKILSLKGIINHKEEF